MLYHIWLQSALFPGNKKTSEILEKFNSARNIYESDIEALISSGLFTKKEIERLKNKSLTDAEKIIAECKRLGVSILTYDAPEFPLCLKNIPDAPVVLYYKGAFPSFDSEPAVCVVGPRQLSDYGSRAAYSISMRLARAGIIIVSGGANGSDTFAHQGALKYSCKTVLVMGCGFGVRYLPEKEPMREKIIATGGCLITEYPPKAPAYAHNFPIRNRIMSALSLGTVVVEAKKSSGTLITANCALEQGKEVFVIPGSPGTPYYEGSNALLREGAIPLIDASDIFNEYIPRFPDKINIEKAYEKPSIPENEKNSENKENNKKILDLPLSKEAKMLYNQLDKHEFYPDEFSNTTLSDDEIFSALTELEINGIIKAVPGGKYRKI